MRPEYQKYQTIDRYLNNEMSGTELKEFEQQLIDNPDFMEDVWDQKLANDIIMENRFFKVMDSINLAPVAAKPVISNAVKAILGIGGGAAVVLMTIFFTNEKPEEAANVQEQNIVVEELVAEELPADTHLVSMDNVVEEEEIVAEEPLIKEVMKQTEPVQKPAKPAKTTKKKESKGDGSYILEIPLEGNDIHTAFKPAAGELWKIPLKDNKNADFIVLDKSGKEVYRTKIVNGVPDKWNGANNNKEKLDSDTYVYLLEYGNGKVDHGYVKLAE